jgi:hypothetical protein
LIEALNRRGLDAMMALPKFLVLLAIFLSASNPHSFTNLSPVIGNQDWVNHLIQFEESMSIQSNEPSRKPTNDQINEQTTNQTKQ